MTINLVDSSDIANRKVNKYGKIFCDRCNGPFKDTGHGTHYKEKINGNWTGKLICHKCYTKDRNNLPGSHNNIRKEFNRIEGKSKKRVEDNCIICNKDLNSIPATIWGHPMKQYINDEWTGHWLCYDCWYNTDYKYRPDTKAEIIKSMRDRRLGTQDPNSSNAKGDKYEEWTCKWRGVQRIGVITNNYLSPIDHTRDPELGILQTRGIKIYYGAWHFAHLEREWDKEFDNFIFYCNDENGNLERIYIIPKKEIVGRKKITMTKNYAYGWYEKYRVKQQIVQEVIKIISEGSNDVTNDITNVS